MIIQYDVKLQ